MTRRNSPLAVAEAVAWTVGVACLTAWAGLGWWSSVAARAEIDRFEAQRTAHSLETAAPDLTLWSKVRVDAWRETLTQPAPAPLAVLRIPRLHLEAPVLEGTDDETLNRGVGHIADTALPGANGNSGIAGHRDGFFRGLKDIKEGDELVIETLRDTETYRVERIWIVTPEDVSVLDPTPSRAVTLVTCYPFYFIGSAPQRFIVRAVRSSPAGHP